MARRRRGRRRTDRFPSPTDCSPSTARASARAAAAPPDCLEAGRLRTGAFTRVRRDVHRRSVPARRFERHALIRRGPCSAPATAARCWRGRTTARARVAETTLGTQWLGTPHRYRIDWTASSVTYSIDGAPVTSHTVAIATPMRPIAASDFNPNFGNIVVDWVRLLPYAAAGSFESRVFDASSAVDWATIYRKTVTPAGTTLAIFRRTGAHGDPDTTWTHLRARWRRAATTPGIRTRATCSIAPTSGRAIRWSRRSCRTSSSRPRARRSR